MDLKVKLEKKIELFKNTYSQLKVGNKNINHKNILVNKVNKISKIKFKFSKIKLN